MPLAGQPLSKESIAKMQQSKVLRQNSKYNWTDVDPYLDCVLNNGSRNRKTKFITLREFKDLVEKGLSSKNMINQGISKHLINFFSNLTQGKIKISKEQFEKEYESGLSLQQIADKHCITIENITFLRQLFDVKAKGATFQERKRTEIRMSQRQIEIMYGSMMGDAKRVSNSAVGFGHSDKQKDYLMWKFKEFENVASKNSLQGRTYLDKRYGSEGINWRFYTCANTDAEDCISEFYKSGSKQVTWAILERLTPLSVAVWFMDDGKTDFKHRMVKNLHSNTTPTCVFCTESFSKESCEIIQKWFKDRFNIGVRLKEKALLRGFGYRIIVCNEDTTKFLELISPFVLPHFDYKINYQKYIQTKVYDGDVLLADIIKCPLGDDFIQLSLTEQDEWISKILQYWRKRGFNGLFARPKYLYRDAKGVVEYSSSKLYHNDCIGFCVVGSRFLSSHFTHIWEARAKGNKSPREIFENDRYLKEIIRSIVIRNKFPKPQHILHKMHRYRGNKSVSNFMPCVAKAVFDKYCQPGSRVIDFCAGYGGRLFGAFASANVSAYVGIDVNQKNYISLINLYDSLRTRFDVSKTVNVFNQDAVAGMKMFSDKSFDVCFTSVPYFDAEEYEDSSNQSYKKYSQYSDWFDKFLTTAVKEVMRISKTVIINVANTGAHLIGDDFRKWLIANSITFREDRIRFPKFGGKYFFEPLFVISSE